MNRKISETLREAQEWLWDGEDRFDGRAVTPFICHAIDKALGLKFGESQHLNMPEILLLEEAGMPLCGGGFLSFVTQRDFERREEEQTKQVWRHAWLDLMIQFCEEEGL